MQFTTTIATILAAATIVSAGRRPARRDDASGNTVCAQGTQVACCTTDSSDSDIGGNVLGGSCLLDNLSLLSSLNNNCPAANSFCCPSNTDGSINANVQCIPITA